MNTLFIKLQWDACYKNKYEMQKLPFLSMYVQYTDTIQMTNIESLNFITYQYFGLDIEEMKGVQFLAQPEGCPISGPTTIELLQQQ